MYMLRIMINKYHIVITKFQLSHFFYFPLNHFRVFGLAISLIDCLVFDALGTKSSSEL